MRREGGRWKIRKRRRKAEEILRKKKEAKKRNKGTPNKKKTHTLKKKTQNFQKKKLKILKTSQKFSNFFSKILIENFEPIFPGFECFLSINRENLFSIFLSFSPILILQQKASKNLKILKFSQDSS